MTSECLPRRPRRPALTLGDASLCTCELVDLRRPQRRPYGEDAERLSRLGRALADRHGASTYAEAVQRGRSMAGEHVITYALTEIARALARMEALDAASDSG